MANPITRIVIERTSNRPDPTTGEHWFAVKVSKETQDGLYVVLVSDVEHLGIHRAIDEAKGVATFSITAESAMARGCDAQEVLR